MANKKEPRKSNSSDWRLRERPKSAFICVARETRRDKSLFKTWSEIRDSTKAAEAGKVIKAKVFPYLQKLFSKSCRQMAREIKAAHNNKNRNKNNSKLS